MKLKNPKRKGTAFENKVKKDLESKGYLVIRQSASRFPDLIAIKEDDACPGLSFVLLVECKCGKYISKQEKEQFSLLEDRTCGLPVIAYPTQKEIHYCNIVYHRMEI